MYCQLETLRHSVQPDVLGTLERLPKTLDETYERLLKNINENNRRHARYLLHCLAVSVRPLRVEELAEILTFDFDAAAEGSTPTYRPDRRPSNQEAAILSICSNLITVVDNRGSRVVQFSHLSVKEFLTSDHLASTKGDLSLYHVLPEHAHTILAQACLGFLLHPNDCNGSPLAEYAAQYWVTHAQFEDVATHVTGGIESLLDPEKPYFSAWIRLFDPDGEASGRLPSEMPSPLYYLVHSGFHQDLIRRIAIKYPEHINATGGLYGSPLDAALCRNDFPVAELLLEHGGGVDVRDARNQTALHKTIDRHDKVAIDRVKFLLGHGADVNAQRDDLWTPLHLAFRFGELNVARVLFDHQADVNARNDDGQTPLHLLSRWKAEQDEDDGSEYVKRLLELGANVNEKDKDNATPLHLASYYKRLEIVRVLLDSGANTDVENDQGKIPLQMALMRDGHSQGNGIGIARLLLAHGAEAYARDKFPISASNLAGCFAKEEIGQVLLDNGDPSQTESSWDETFLLWMEGKYHSQMKNIISWCLIPFLGRGVEGKIRDIYETILLHSASCQGTPETVETLLNHGVKLDAKNHWSETVLHVVSRGRQDSQGEVRVAKLLLERGMNVNTRRKDHWTPLHLASYFGNVKIVRLLLDHGADLEAEEGKMGEKPLHQVSYGKYRSKEDGVHVAQLLLERRADVNTRRKDHWTPLHVASYFGNVVIVRLLLDRGADLEAAEGKMGEKPFHQVSYGKYKSQEDGIRVARLLLEHGADVNTRRKDHWTPLHHASYFGNVEIARLLLDHGANSEANAEGDMKPLHQVSYGKCRSQEDGVRVARLLLERGADVNTRRKDHWTPLHLASYFGNVEIVRLLLDYGADPEANAEGDMGAKPLHQVSRGKYRSQEDGVRVAQLLLKRGANVNTRRNDHRTPLHIASRFGKVEIVQLLIDRGAKIDAVDNSGTTPLHEVSKGNYESQEAGVRVAQLLLDRGADVSAKARSGDTPRALASSNQMPYLTELFLEHAKNVNLNAPRRSANS